MYVALNFILVTCLASKLNEICIHKLIRAINFSSPVSHRYNKRKSKHYFSYSWSKHTLLYPWLSHWLLLSQVLTQETGVISPHSFPNYSRQEPNHAKGLIITHWLANNFSLHHSQTCFYMYDKLQHIHTNQTCERG